MEDDQSSDHSKRREGLAGIVTALLVLFPAVGLAGHLDESDLREEGLELEIEDLEVDRDDHRLRVEYDIDSSDWQRAQRAGLSLWLGIFVERGDEGSGQWDLWYSMPLISEDGSAEYPNHMDLEREHVVARLVAVSNGTLLSPGHGLFTDGSIFVAVRGNHDDDHSHGDSNDTFVRRHVELEHRSSALYSVDTHLSFVGSLHQYQWFAPHYGFHQLRTWLQRQHLLTREFHRHLHHHHGHTCGCGGLQRETSSSSHGRHHRTGTHHRIEIRVE